MGRKPTDSPAHGRVTVCPTGHRGGVVRRPDGSVLPTPRSQTAGIQEAVDFATSHGCDMYIAGGVEPGKGGPVIYTCDRTVKIPPVQGFTFGTGSVTLYFTPEVGDKPGLEFDSAMLTDFSLSGQVYYEANGPAVRFAPRRQLPLDAETVITDSFFRFGAVAVDGGPKADCVAFAPKGGGIVYNTFEFGEINGGARGIVVESPAPTKAFASNRLACMHVHDQTQVCVQVGHERLGVQPVEAAGVRVYYMVPLGFHCARDHTITRRHAQAFLPAVLCFGESPPALFQPHIDQVAANAQYRYGYYAYYPDSYRAREQQSKIKIHLILLKGLRGGAPTGPAASRSVMGNRV